MSHTIVQNTRAGQEPPVIPPHEEGEPWQYEMIYSDGDNRAYAHTTSDLMEVLHPGYGAMPETDQAQARIAIAEMSRLTAQAIFIAEATPVLSDQDATAASVHPFEGHWGGAVPLVLINCYYEPYTEVPRPTGTVFEGGISTIAWLDVNTSSTLLEGLHAIGTINLATRS